MAKKHHKYHKKLHQPVAWNVAIPVIAVAAVVAGYLLMTGLGQDGAYEDTLGAPMYYGETMNKDK